MAEQFQFARPERNATGSEFILQTGLRTLNKTSLTSEKQKLHTCFCDYSRLNRWNLEDSQGEEFLNIHRDEDCSHISGWKVPALKCRKQRAYVIFPL